VAAAATEALGLYVYGVTLAGVPCACQTVDQGRLRAVVGEEPLDRSTPEAFETSLQDPSWLEERLREHEAVLEAVQAAGPVAPFRFGTLFRTEQDLRERLAAVEEQLADRLEELRGTAEWGVKAWVDEDVLRRRLEEDDQELRRGRNEIDTAATAGRRYLLEKKHQRRLGESAAELAYERACAAHATLAGVAREACVDRPTGLEETSERRAVLRASYLVDDTCLDGFRAAVEEAGARDAEIGLVYTVSGPWPPYSFVDLQLT
jgi:gas vesicle protein GvpL/GvpF